MIHSVFFLPKYTFLTCRCLIHANWNSVLIDDIYKEYQNKLYLDKISFSFGVFYITLFSSYSLKTRSGKIKGQKI